VLKCVDDEYVKLSKVNVLKDKVRGWLTSKGLRILVKFIVYDVEFIKLSGIESISEVILFEKVNEVA
jgi:hypothetical protein